MFCKHEWEIKDKTILPSAWEQATDRKPTKKVPSWVFTKKLVVIVACKKCGKLNKIVEENP